MNPIWPALPLDSWNETYVTLHLWTQVVGKILVKQASPVNHWWATALHVTPRGLKTASIPYGTRAFDIEFDFIDHLLAVRTDDGQFRALALVSKSVADFYHELMAVLRSIGIDLQINTEPKEIMNPIRFEDDQIHSEYDPAAAHRHWRILSQADRVLKEFRSRFVGKCSPVHFFWGSFDLTVTRFSGQKAPERPGADRITQLAYSHEVSSCGFWPGGGNVLEPAFYSYAAPEPEDFSATQVLPSSAFYNPPTKGFILRYEDVRQSADPDRMILDFCQSTYEAAANLGGWDREALEHHGWRLKRAA